MKAPKFKKVTVYDYSGYNAATSSNGGDYGFWQVYRPIAADRYEVRHYTTADFSYCEYCGSFNQGDCGCWHEPETVSEAELLQLIREANMDASEDVWAEAEPWSLSTKELRSRIQETIRDTDKVGDLILIADKLGVSYQL